MPYRDFWHRSPTQPPSPPPEPAADPAPADEPPITLRVPLLTRLEHLGDQLSDRLHGATSDPPAPGDAPAAHQAVAHAVVELPATGGLRRFFGNPLEGVEGVAARVVHRALRQAELSVARFACRWVGAGMAAGLGLCAGLANLRAEPSWANPQGVARPWLGWPLMAAAFLPLPVAGAWFGRWAAHLGSLDLVQESAAHRAAPG